MEGPDETSSTPTPHLIYSPTHFPKILTTLVTSKRREWYWTRGPGVRDSDPPKDLPDYLRVSLGGLSSSEDLGPLQYDGTKFQTLILFFCHFIRERPKSTVPSLVCDCTTSQCCPEWKSLFDPSLFLSLLFCP